MKPRLMILALTLALVVAGSAQAQITITYLDRYVGCQMIPPDLPTLTWRDYSGDPGPYLGDLDITEGSQHMRSNQDSSVLLEGDNLTVTGSYLGVVSSEDQAAIFDIQASANLLVTFIPTVPSVISVEADLPVYAEAYCFDGSDPQFGFDFPGPGTVTLDETLVPGHEYLFQVFYAVHVWDEGPAQAESATTFSLMVEPDPVAVAAASWGGVKALFR